jgi:hypothetical protein
MSARELPYLKSRFVRHIPLEPGIPLPGNSAEDQFRRALHTEVVIPPVDRKIHVDGDLSEWGDEGSFFSRRDAERSVEGRMRYDADAFYIGARIADPAPMRNSIDPFMDGELGWRGGGLQVRLSLDRTQGWPVDANSPGYYRSRHITATPEQIARAENERLVTLTLWHHAPSATDCLHVAFGFDFSGGQVNPPGYTSVFKRDADGAGYTIEARVRRGRPAHRRARNAGAYQPSRRPSRNPAGPSGRNANRSRTHAGRVQPLGRARLHSAGGRDMGRRARAVCHPVP